jgi:hypothetical protein
MVDEAEKDEVGGGSVTHEMNSSHRSGTNVVHPTWFLDPTSPWLTSERTFGPVPQYVVVRRLTSPLPLSSPDVRYSLFSSDLPPPTVSVVIPMDWQQNLTEKRYLAYC